MNPGIIIALLVPCFTILMVVIALSLLNQNEIRRDTRQIIRELNTLNRELTDHSRSMERQMKDFHGRLCAIEERRKQ